jgi:hypothetical protein
MIFASLETGIIALIVGIALIVIANRVTIEPIVNNILYVVGAILAILGIIALLLFFVGIVV